MTNPVTIISLTGNPAAGKTTLVRNIRDAGHLIGWWCIKDHWYIPQGIVVDGKMCWPKFRERMPAMRRSLADAMLEAGLPVFAIEHSGAGKWIGRIIRRLEQRRKVVHIHLLPRLVGTDEPSLFWRTSSRRRDGLTYEAAHDEILATINATKNTAGGEQ